jgi:hypothetical protein
MGSSSEFSESDRFGCPHTHDGAPNLAMVVKEVLLGIENTVFGVVKNVCGCDGACATLGKNFFHMVPCTSTSKRDDGYLDGRGDAPNQVDIITLTATIAVDRLNQDFTGPSVLSFLSPKRG